jgi:hypothetical protein
MRITAFIVVPGGFVSTKKSYLPGQFQLVGPIISTRPEFSVSGALQEIFLPGNVKRP